MTVTSPTVILRQDNRTLNLNSGRYKPVSFVPPSARLTPMIAGGTSANAYGGGVKTGERAADRAWTFSVRAIGSSQAECERAGNTLADFLALATKQKPVYLEYRGNSDVAYEPVWSQYGASHRFEIIHANPPQPWERYLDAGLREKGIVYSVECVIRPFQYGKKQPLATTTGGILENTIGTADRRSRGVQIPEATTNKITNPIFGNVTWNDGWTADASLAASENTDSDYLLFGSSGAKLQSTAANQEFYRTVNVGNTNTHTLSCYAKIPSGGSFSSTTAVLYYNGSTQSTTFVNVGNGWYRMHASFSGVASSTSVGIQVKSGYTIYVSGFQLEEKEYPTPMCYGDLLGCAWSGTVHASTSTRTACTFTIPFSYLNYNMSQITFRVVLDMSSASSLFSSVLTFLHSGLGGFLLEWDTDHWAFTDGTNTANGSSTTFLARDKVVLHVTCGNGGIVLYKDGVSIATNATYTPPTTPTTIYIGSTAVGGFHGNVTFSDVAIFAETLTAAEVLADYTNLYQVIADDEMLSPMPWLWTKDGDNIVDNCDDSSRDNYAVIGGVPGNYPAVTEWLATRSVNWSTNTHLLFSNILADTMPDVDTLVFVDQNSTSPSANDSGDGYTSYSVGTSQTSIAVSNTSSKFMLLMAGRAVVPFLRLSDAGSGPKLSTYLTDGVVFAQTDFLNATIAATRVIVKAPAMVVPFIEAIASALQSQLSVGLGVYAKRASGTANIEVDYCMFLPEPMILGSHSSSNTVLLYHSEDRVARSSYTNSVPFSGWAIEFWPNKLNILLSLVYSNNGASVITRTLTYTSVYVTPRWALL